MSDDVPGPKRHPPLDGDNSYGEEAGHVSDNSKPSRAADTINGGESRMGRIDDIEGRVEHYMDQGMDVTDAAEAAYDDIATKYENDAASMEEVQTAVQELETYVEDKGGDLQAAAASLDTKIDDTLDRVNDASDRIDDVYDDLLG
jgi:23S rRNA maturation-related 3'-5' exoribonuclease YhaM